MSGGATTSTRMSVVLLVKDEADTIGPFLRQLWDQDLFRRTDVTAEVLVVANGCTDRTVEVARAILADLPQGPRLHGTVHDLVEGGKSRSWNIAVHELISKNSDLVLFLDCDVELVGSGVFSTLLDRLSAAPQALACSGFPLKAAARAEKPTLVQRFSLRASTATRYADAICGQCYLVRRSALDTLWLPLRTPGEDGFVNAMLHTDGFSRPSRPGTVVETDVPTHYMEDIDPAEYLTHETRLLVGTMVNIWLFEHFMSLKSDQPLGPAVRRWNEEDPGWAERIVAARASAGRWVIPRSLLLRRLKTPGEVGWKKALLSLPVTAAAALLTLPPAIRANRRLKQRGATAVW